MLLRVRELRRKDFEISIRSARMQRDRTIRFICWPVNRRDFAGYSAACAFLASTFRFPNTYSLIENVKIRRNVP